MSGPMQAGRLRCPACIMAPGRQESVHMTFVPIKVSLAAREADAGKSLREATR